MIAIAQYRLGRRVQGFSLIELMIAMVLGLLILAAVMTVFTSMRVSYQTQNALARMQESARYVLEEIAIDTRAAGFIGCTGDRSRVDSSLAAQNSYFGNILAGIQGFDGTGSGWDPSAPTATGEISNPVDDSDILVLRRPGQTIVTLAADMASTSSVLTMPAGVVATDGLIDVGTILIVTDCLRASAFQVSSIDSTANTVAHAAGGSLTPSNSTGNLGARYRTGAQVYIIDTVSYYVHTSTSGAGLALWRKTNQAAGQELIEGVESFEIQFGVDTSGDGSVDEYVEADSATPTEVVAVRVSLLIASLDEVGESADTQTYVVGSENLGPFNDRRIRRVFTKTITVRNRTQ
ncbi:MAG: hypothetical protein CMH65_15610 [Nevskiales bacterium]|nr:hypothetical protein [Nevskiales bacterium]